MATYYALWDGKHVEYNSLPAARKGTMARMSKEWVHIKGIYSEGKLVGEIHRNAINDEYWSVKGRSIVKYTLYSNGSVKAKTKRRS